MRAPAWWRGRCRQGRPLDTRRGAAARRQRQKRHAGPERTAPGAKASPLFAPFALIDGAPLPVGVRGLLSEPQTHERDAIVAAESRSAAQTAARDETRKVSPVASASTSSSHSLCCSHARHPSSGTASGPQSGPQSRIGQSGEGFVRAKSDRCMATSGRSPRRTFAHACARRRFADGLLIGSVSHVGCQSSAWCACGCAGATGRRKWPKLSLKLGLAGFTALHSHGGG